MKNSEAKNQNDKILLPFLESVSETDAQTTLSELLLHHIQPIIEKNLQRKMHTSLKPNDFSPNNQEALEIAGEAKFLLIAELNKLKENSHDKTIQNLDNYAASVTINAYREYLRKKYPQRRQLKNKLRYLLTHHPNFALLETENGWICGNAHEINLETSSPETLQSAAEKIIDRPNLREEKQTIELVKAIFNNLKTPVLFNDFLTFIAETQGIKDKPEISLLPEKSTSVEEKKINELEQREILRLIWAEIGELPVRHRAALLLNLKDKHGEPMIFLFPVLRIATIRQIAEILEFPAEKFAEIWGELPWEDYKISEHLGLSRQQVINLRQSARARLNRLFTSSYF